MARYDAHKLGRACAVTAPAVQYKDYAAWRSQRLAGPVGDRLRTHWLARLAGLQTPALPLDHPRPAQRSHRGGAVRAHLSNEQLQALKDLARAKNATLFVALVAAIDALLHRYTGADDIVVGTAVAGRDHADLSELVGVHVNLLALRTPIDRRAGFAALVAQARDVVVDSLEHGEYPFDRLVEELGLARELGRTPLFDVLVVLQNQEAPLLALSGLRIVPEPQPVRTSVFDLSFEFLEEPQGLLCELHYAADVFGSARAEAILGHFIHLLTAALAAPEAPLGDLLLEPAGHERVAGPQSPLPAVTLTELVDQKLRAAPDTLAVVCQERRLTRGELDRTAAQVAGALAQAGVTPGQVVAVILPRSELLPALFLGILRVGAIFLPLEDQHPSERLRVILADAAAVAVIAEPELGAQLGWRPRALAPGTRGSVRTRVARGSYGCGGGDLHLGLYRTTQRRPAGASGPAEYRVGI